MMKKATDESLKIARLIHVWLMEYLCEGQGFSEKTQASYEYAISLFLTFLEEKRGITAGRFNADCFSVKNIEAYLAWLKEYRNCSVASCNNRLAAVRSFLKYVAAHEPTLSYLYQNATLIMRKKDKKRQVSAISKQGMKYLFAQPNCNTKTGLRDLMLFSILYVTAGRINEILSLRIQDVRFDSTITVVTVVGKGNKIRTLPIEEKTVKLLKLYISRSHGRNPIQGSYLFYSRNTGKETMLSQDAVTKQLKMYAAKAHLLHPEVPTSISPHQIRRSRATHLLEDGVPIVQISRLLGHAHLSTTMIYVEVSNAMMVKALENVEALEMPVVAKKWKETANLALLTGIKQIKKN